MDINQLYLAAREGDSQARSDLFRRLKDSFGYLARHRIRVREDCEEVVQDALAAVAERGFAIEVKVSFSAWAYRVLGNKISDYYRARGRRDAKLVALDELDEELGSGTPDLDLRRRLLDCLRKLMGHRAGYIRVLNLHYQGFSTEEIRARMGLTRNSVHILLSRARKMLLECLEKGDIS
ncbi:MAG: RNA polymerase sigma factor [candidate division Zixibacteria bacterium]|nr:RNA polymerase sigma factor [candidate division Zixibacteria bacterium]